MCHKVTQKATDSRHNSVKIDTIDVKFEWTFPDSVIFLPHNCLMIVVWLFCCLHLGNVDRMEDDFLWKTTSYL